jgi:aryl sulfotransferase
VTDDIVVATYPEFGTSRIQRIVDLLIIPAVDRRSENGASSWLQPGAAQAPGGLSAPQGQPRLIKTHMALSDISCDERTKLIHVTRDGRDACLALRNFEFATVMDRYRVQHQESGATEDAPPDVAAYFDRWLQYEEQNAIGHGGVPAFCSYENSFWMERGRPNLLLVHHNDLLRDPTEEMRRIAEFLEVDVPSSWMAKLLPAAHFGSGSARVLKSPNGMGNLSCGAGTDRRWNEIFAEADLERYETLIGTRFSSTAATWVSGGRTALGDPRHAPD